MTEQEEKKRKQSAREKEKSDRRKNGRSILQLLRELDGQDFILTIPIEGGPDHEYEESL